MKKLLVMILAATILSLFVGCAVAEEEIPITFQTSPDGNYKVTLYQVGEPTWSFGSVSAKLILEEAGGIVTDWQGNKVPFRYNLQPSFRRRQKRVRI